MSVPNETFPFGQIFPDSFSCQMCNMTRVNNSKSALFGLDVFAMNAPQIFFRYSFEKKSEIT